MAELFKNLYNDRFLNRFLSLVCQVIPSFDRDGFLNGIYDEEWAEKELKQRMRHISIVLEQHLKGPYSDQLKSLLEIIKVIQAEGDREESVEFMFFPDFVEVFGIEHYDASMQAMEVITQFTSCEFAIRPFIIKYEKESIVQLKAWSEHESHHVRRLSSEGCRPRLPWAMALPSFKKDPTPILPILENLKHDPSEYVRRSVANNLNDIAKDNPGVVIDIAKKWKGQSKETDALIKHACRTLLKQGNQEMMELFGFGSVKHLLIEDYKVTTPKICIGDSIEFSFQLKNESKHSALVRLEYGIYYQKANGTLSRKVFKISEREYSAHSVTEVVRKQSFRLITTRVFHPGLHQVSIILNGKEFEKLDFELVNRINDLRGLSSKQSL